MEKKVCIICHKFVTKFLRPLLGLDAVLACKAVSTPKMNNAFGKVYIHSSLNNEYSSMILLKTMLGKLISLQIIDIILT